jgi:hypothetical protein
MTWLLRKPLAPVTCRCRENVSPGIRSIGGSAYEDELGEHVLVAGCDLNVTKEKEGELGKYHIL